MAKLRRNWSHVLIISLALMEYSSAKFQPIIGVMMQNINGMHCNDQYAMTNYQSFIAQGGAGAVPIFVDQPDSYYEQLIPRLNGVLLPGGGLDNLVTSPFANVSKLVFDMAMKMNDGGVHFPVWGTCQGFEEMTTLPLKPQQDLLSNCSGTEGVLLPLNYTAAVKTSRLFKDMLPSLKDTLAKAKITPNFHNLCLSTKTFRETQQLNNFYTVLSTNVDVKGLEFVSTMEAKEYPFYATQWHPEKINYNFVNGLNNDPTFSTAMIAQYFGNFLVQEANKNSNSFHSDDEAARFLFNNYPTQFTGGNGAYLDIYCLKKTDAPKFDRNM